MSKFTSRSKNRVYIIAEMSANHCGDYSKAVGIVKAAKEAGADAIKIQTYTADTMTIDCRKDLFKIKGTIWNDRYFYELYKSAHTPWEWQPKLRDLAYSINLDFIGTPFDQTAVDFLEQMGTDIYKIASFELVDIPLLQRVAKTGKPIILSTGMSTRDEIDEAVEVLRNTGCNDFSLLKCTSSYPAKIADMNLETLKDMSNRYGIPVGLSDHSLSNRVPVIATAMGASIIEKHFILSHDDNSPDAKFSLDPAQFKEMVNSVREVEKIRGEIKYEPVGDEKTFLGHRRSLFIVDDIKKGEIFTKDNVKSIRPADGIHPRYMNEILGSTATCDCERGTPMSWGYVEKK